VFLKKFKSSPPYPQKDPHVLEAMGIHCLVPEEISATTTTGGGR
jgi:hypothetical protein